MKALILAAGLGTRLAPLTDRIPKTLVPVNGTPIIFKQLQNLIENGVRDISIVCGYRAEQLKNAIYSVFPEAHFIDNLDYAETNNMYSAYLARKYFDHDSFLMMNGDVFFDSSVIKDLLDFQSMDAIAVDVGHYQTESMKVVQKDEQIISISKEIPRDKAYGVSIDVYKFSKKASAAFFSCCTDYIERKKELKNWSEVALNDILGSCFFQACPLRGRWYEVDDHEDLKNAEKLFLNID